MANFPKDETGELGSPSPVRATPELLIVFRVGDMRLAIDVQGVSEVTRAIPVSVPLPKLGGIVCMITLRGESATVIDLAVVLGVPRGARDRRARLIAIRRRQSTVCLWVDQVDGLHEVRDGDLEPPPPMIAEIDVGWLDYITRSASGEMIGVINVDHVLSQPSIIQLSAEVPIA